MRGTAVLVTHGSICVNWINNVVRPRISGLLTKRRDPPEDFWHKCPACGQMTDKNALVENQHVFPCCNHHGRMTAPERMAALFDGGTYKTIATKDAPLDPDRRASCRERVCLAV